MTDTTANSTAETTDGHGSGHAKPHYDDINVPTVVIVGFISAVVTVITILFVKGLLGVWMGKYERLRMDEVVNMPAREQIETQKQLLVGGDGGTISIEEAGAKVLEKYGSK